MTVEIKPRGRVEQHSLVDGTSNWWGIDRGFTVRGLVSTALRNSTRFGNPAAGDDGVLWLWHATPCACACHVHLERDIEHLVRAGGRAQPTDLLELLEAIS